MDFWLLLGYAEEELYLLYYRNLALKVDAK
jgi:hypothetical protein